MAVLWRIADLVSTLSIIKKITGTDDIQPEKSSSKYRQITKGEGKRLGVSAGNHEWDSTEENEYEAVKAEKKIWDLKRQFYAAMGRMNGMQQDIAQGA